MTLHYEKIIEEMARAISNSVHDKEWDILKQASPLTAKAEIIRAKAALSALQDNMPDGITTTEIIKAAGYTTAHFKSIRAELWTELKNLGK